MEKKLIFKINHTGGSTGNTIIRYVEAEYLATDKTKICDLFPFFDEIVKTRQDEIDSCARFCRFKVDNKRVTAIDDFGALLFLELNGIDVDDIQIDYCYAGIGAGEYINDKMKIYIPSSEKNHLERPHIHISNCKGNNSVVFSLIDISILAGRENWGNYFTRKERKNVIECLTENQKEFTSFYNDLSKGNVPKPVKFKYGNNGKTYYLMQDNKTK